jgi:branched-chain amino acid transport system substrate-binding protein
MLRATAVSPLIATTMLIYAAAALGECKDPGKEPGRFRIQGVELTDTRTGLIWLRCPGGYVTALGECDPAMVLPATTWAGAMQANVKSPPGPAGNWHLASVEELEAVIAKGCGRLFDPKLIDLAFDEVWTGSEAGGGMVWLVDKNGARLKLPKVPRDPKTGGDFFAQALYVRNTETASASARTAAKTTPRAAAQESGPVVLIGHAGPLSNRLSRLGKDAENGVRLAIDESNAANVMIGGRRVSFLLVSEDDQADAKLAPMVAQRLIDAKVAGVIGHLTSPTSIAASYVYDKANIPVIADASTNPALTEHGLRNVFRVIARADSEVPAMARMLLEKARPRSVLIVDDGSPYGEAISNELESALRPHARVDRRKWRSGATDSALASIRGLNPDAIFFGGMDETAETFIPQARQANSNALLAVGDAACAIPLARLGAVADGVLCPQIVPPIAMADRRFVEAYRAKFNAEPLDYSPYSYDATKVLIEAMKRANSTEPRNYLPELMRIQYAGVTGTIAFDGKGDRRDPDVTIFEVRNGRLSPIAVVHAGRTVQPLRSEAPERSAVDPDAKAIVDRFISAVKIAGEVPEARQTVRELSWVDIRPSGLIGEKTIYEGMFDTDIQGVKGYKRLIEARSQASVEVPARYVLVAYKDRTSGIWKVFDIRDLKGSDSGHEVEAVARDLENTQHVKKQVNYRRYAYWLAFDGKVEKAKQAYDTAIELNNADPDQNWAKYETGRFQALQAITGK